MEKYLEMKNKSYFSEQNNYENSKWMAEKRSRMQHLLETLPQMALIFRMAEL